MGWRLQGPGIPVNEIYVVRGLPSGFDHQWANNLANFLGVWTFSSAHLPRSWVFHVQHASCTPRSSDMYVAVKGGETAILNSYKLLAAQRRGDTKHPELTVTRSASSSSCRWNRVMTEGSVYDPELAAAGHQTSQRRSGGKPSFYCAPIAPPLPGWAAPVLWKRPTCNWTAVSRPPSRTCPVARCWAPLTTTRSGCSTSAC
ncbi:hypothetical protein GHT06_006610 [Daphnia sinensis]|uniref:Uncharacterized protein n=1 Tax=Daphnia sinensis TaxID=1820382 RepID=A0AAD5KT82_9CRUS|nr:hypothetical protein GHT06_006610 [Daphnia sinensis]